MSTNLLKRDAGLEVSSKNSVHSKILLVVRPQNLVISSVVRDISYNSSSVGSWYSVVKISHEYISSVTISINIIFPFK